MQSVDQNAKWSGIKGNGRGIILHDNMPSNCMLDSFSASARMDLQCSIHAKDFKVEELDVDTKADEADALSPVPDADGSIEDACTTHPFWYKAVYMKFPCTRANRDALNGAGIDSDDDSDEYSDEEIGSGV